MNAEMISYPNTTLMCSVNVDPRSAAAALDEKLLGCMKRAVRIRASVLREHLRRGEARLEKVKFTRELSV